MTQYSGPAQHTCTPACDGFHEPGPCTPQHPATVKVLQYFQYDHLPARLQEISRPFHDLAHSMASLLDGAELTVGLRKLLEAKDCCVRAALDRED